MANFAQARDGRKSLSFILEPTGTALDGTGSLAIGDMGFILAKAAEGAFKDLKENTFFIATKATTLTSGDKFMKCKATFLGFATDKSASFSKETVDVTCDYDSQVNNSCDGTISQQGSVSGLAMVEKIDSESGLNILQSRFSSVTEVDKTGTVTYKEASTSEKDILMIVWNGRDVKIGDYLDIDIIPALFTNLSKEASYGSSQTFNVDYTGNATDENGYIGGNFKVEYVEGLLPSIARPVTA